MLDKNYLICSYLRDKKSAAQIAIDCNCSVNQVNYWLSKYEIQKRSISDAVYIKLNPKGDPFSVVRLSKSEEWFLYGLGLGLFWGEGNKVNKNAVRLGNTDPDLIVAFLSFLKIIYQIDERKLRFGLQLFTDIPKEKALRYWCDSLGVSKTQFQKVVITKSTKSGTYRKKSKYGVITVYFSNTKLRDTIIGAIEDLRKKMPM